MKLPQLPFQFRVNGYPTVYTAEKLNYLTEVVVSWVSANERDKIFENYSQRMIEEYIEDGTWQVIEPTLPIKVALKIRLFEMRIQEMEKSLATLKEEFARHKIDIKETI